LDIVVETSKLWRVFIEDTAGVVEPKIFEVEVSFRIVLLARVHKGLHKSVILLPPDPVLA
jgi:hypothetical protein